MSDQEQELYMAMGISELESEIATLTTRLAEAEKSRDWGRVIIKKFARELDDLGYGEMVRTLEQEARTEFLTAYEEGKP